MSKELKKVALIGGFDSQIMLRMLRENGETVTGLHLGGLENSDAERATFAEDIIHVEMDLIFTGEWFGDPIYKIPDTSGRNAIACFQAAMMGADVIYFAFYKHEIDSGLSPDTDRSWFDLMRWVLTKTFSRNITIEFPLIEWNLEKKDLVPDKYYNSCYSDPPCRNCYKCVERWYADRNYELHYEESLKMPLQENMRLAIKKAIKERK